MVFTLNLPHIEPLNYANYLNLKCVEGAGEEKLLNGEVTRRESLLIRVSRCRL
jgi:hypothetical protein